jgi:hypothetical protein
MTLKQGFGHISGIFIEQYFFAVRAQMKSALRFLISPSASLEPLGSTGFNEVGLTCCVIYLFCSSNSFGLIYLKNLLLLSL